MSGPHYSFRLQLGFRPHEDWQGDVRAPPGHPDCRGPWYSLFVAYGPTLEPLSPQIKVRLLAGIDHVGVV